MAFTLRWRNDNKKPVVVRIYRDTSPISPASLPEPLAVLSNGETSWDDTTALYGVAYNYFTTVTDPATNRTVNGINTVYTKQQRRGVGPNELVYGTDQLGYFGPLDYDDQFPLGQFQQKVQDVFLARSTAWNAAYRLNLVKFIRNGKILYIPAAGYLTNQMSWADLYAAGMVYGTDDAGPEGGHGDLPDAIQDAKCQWKGDTYRLRVLRGLSDDSDPKAWPFDEKYNGVSHDDTDLTGFSEFNDLFYSTQLYFPKKRRVPGWRYAYPPSSGSTGYQDGHICMEHDTNSNRCLTRGLTNLGSSSVTNITQINYVNHANKNGLYCPVIELVENY